ncbi:hypothetical protein [Amycolatopsis sp. H20-H5]|uniref:hypothetical protein n=1 Tax=Amycolatopsis sp. H20-H5 TaxID=3046309 RepID=UPI002DBA075A|nr:hypothetical protein [Amycolatopsis sp. H20-H5]MEC3979092.1 hypothetical protein [Amycolatopsis sp. H20-H5]
MTQQPGEEPEDRRIETHPDLMNPDWQQHAERDAWLGAKKELKRKQRRQGRGGGRKIGGLVALLVLLALLVAAVVLRISGGGGVNTGVDLGSAQSATATSAATASVNPPRRL